MKNIATNRAKAIPAKFQQYPLVTNELCEH